MQGSTHCQTLSGELVAPVMMGRRGISKPKKAIRNKARMPRDSRIRLFRRLEEAWGCPDTGARDLGLDYIRGFVHKSNQRTASMQYRRCSDRFGNLTVHLRTLPVPSGRVETRNNVQFEGVGMPEQHNVAEIRYRQCNPVYRWRVRDHRKQICPEDLDKHHSGLFFLK